ncbi:hypothetical protein QR680_005900 [Steinernema hermaphroditum]|uniref:SERTA domain-containing protein n=1 Tax=Steinernema hermaphroditum TaxID=289476 RepID=A0AA39HV11_9BILA|nr:hypothetical protein QR680_005900 [Steinernema hermaphroditum]
MVIELCASLSSPPPPTPSASSSSRFSFSCSSSTSPSHSLPSTSPPDTCSDFSTMFDYFLSPSTTNASSSPSTTTATLSSASSHYRFNTFAAELEADDRVGSDGFLSQNLLSSSSPNATFGSSSAPAEVERKRAMLNLSISKIQTINTSHAPISLRKSVLIYNTMKCLQRELSESSERDDVLGSLMEADEAAGATTNGSCSEAMDVAAAGDFKDIEVISELHEPMVQDEEATLGDGEHQWNRDAPKKIETPSADVDPDEEMDISTSPQHLFYDDLFCSSGWSPYRFDSSGWNYLSSSSTFGSGLNISSSASPSGGSTSNSSFFSSGSFIEDYLSVWGGFENESDSLQHHNLSQVDIMHMFGSPRSPHQHQLNNELISQA